MLTEKQKKFLEERDEVYCQVCKRSGGNCPGFYSRPDGTPWYPPCSDLPWEYWVDVERLEEIMKEYEEDA